ncbi:MAG: hypothetical protein ACLQFR_09680 [Streptosporangiaceae bacterium]
MTVLIALGGNAMTAPDGSARPQDQRAAVGVAAESVADIVAAGTPVVLTHGNGPQVGNLLVKNEIAAAAACGGGSGDRQGPEPPPCSAASWVPARLSSRRTSKP